ncbi:MAG: hypothetical protein K2M31_06230 [Muribaculaceae bacterium]|nr:hypothetical protein [Muribaculaceae bacterium]
MKKFKDILFSQDFLIEPGKMEYEFRMKKRSYWWMWILGLAAFFALCLVRCDHSIEVRTVEEQTGKEVACKSVTMKYTSHFLFNEGHLFDSQSNTITSTADEHGIARFENLPCSIFSYIFYAFSQAEYSVECDNYAQVHSPQSGLFHYKSIQIIEMRPEGFNDEAQEDPTAYIEDSGQSQENPPVELLDPCNASDDGREHLDAGTVSDPKSYNMGQTSGNFDIKWDNGGAYPDRIDVYNHTPEEPYDARSPIFSTGMVVDKGSATISFSEGSVITIIVTTGSSDNSDWFYELSCPR